MAISITVYPITAIESQMLKAGTVSVQAHIQGGGKGYLDGYWRALHGLLTQDGQITTLPEVAINSGDIEIPHIEKGAHVIFAQTNVGFAALLWLITEEEIRSYAKKHERAFVALHPVGSFEEFEQEFWHFFVHLRETSYKARDTNCGLIFIKWEE